MKRTSHILKPLNNMSTVDPRSLNRKIKDILENDNNRSLVMSKQGVEESAMTRSTIVMKRQSNVESTSSLIQQLRNETVNGQGK